MLALPTGRRKSFFLPGAHGFKSLWSSRPCSFLAAPMTPSESLRQEPALRAAGTGGKHPRPRSAAAEGGSNPAHSDTCRHTGPPGELQPETPTPHRGSPSSSSAHPTQREELFPPISPHYLYLPNNQSRTQTPVPPEIVVPPQSEVFATYFTNHLIILSRFTMKTTQHLDL